LPELETTRNELGPQGPSILAIALEDGPERLKNIADAFGYHGAIAIHDGELDELRPLGVTSLPGMAFVDRTGLVVSAVSGEQDHAFITKHARSLMR
jgi:hypothetical protein